MPPTPSSPPGCRAPKAAASPTCWSRAPMASRATISTASCRSRGRAPRRRLQLNKGEANYDPLFPFGYGLTYASAKTGAGAARSFRRQCRDHQCRQLLPQRPQRCRHGSWRCAQDGKTTLVTGNSADSEGGALSLRAVDANGLQEGAAACAGTAMAKPRSRSSAATMPKSVNLERQANADMVLQLQYRVDSRAEGPGDCSRWAAARIAAAPST